MKEQVAEPPNNPLLHLQSEPLQSKSLTVVQLEPSFSTLPSFTTLPSPSQQKHFKCKPILKNTSLNGLITLANSTGDVNSTGNEQISLQQNIVIRVKQKYINIVLRNVDRISMLFGVQFTYSDDECNNDIHLADEKVIAMYFQQYKTIGNDTSDLNCSLQVNLFFNWWLINKSDHLRTK